MLLPNLTRLTAHSAALSNFHGLSIPQHWELPDHLWAAVRRSDMVCDAWTELVVKSVAVFEAGYRYISLVNARADWLFRRDDAGLRMVEQPGGREVWMRRDSKRLDLLLRTGAVTGWDVEYHRSREVLEDVLADFVETLDEGTFMRLAKVLCPSGEARRALDEWLEGTVGELVDVAPAWLTNSFTLRSTLREVAEKHGEVRILADVLDSTDDGDAGDGRPRPGRCARGVVQFQRKQIFDLRYGSLTPLCKLAWVTESLANRIANADEGVGPIM